MHASRACVAVVGESHDQVRKKPHILYWVKALALVKTSGGCILKTITLWDQSQSMCTADQLSERKKTAVLNLLDGVPPAVLQLCLDHVDEVGDFSDSGYIVACSEICCVHCIVCSLCYKSGDENGVST